MCIRDRFSGLTGQMSADMAIDLGTANTLVAITGEGIVINEPSVVAIEKSTQRVLAVGHEAKNMINHTPDAFSAEHPLKDGVIADYDVTEAMISAFINKAAERKYPWQPKPRIVVCIPCGATSVEKRAVFEATIQAGARQAYLIEEPMAAAMGADLPVTEPTGSMVVDIGGGTTDIAVLSLGGKVKATSVRVAGNHYDDEILKHVRNKFSIAIGQRTAEQLKKNVACCPQKADFDETMEVKGRSLLTGLPIKVNVSTSDLYEPVMMLSEQIGTAAHQVLEKTPPELAGDIFRNGVVLTGGGAQLHGLPEYLSQELKVDVTVSPDPVNCVALGTAMSLGLNDKLETGFLDATPRMGRR